MRYVLALLLFASIANADVVVGINGVKTVPFESNPRPKAKVRSGPQHTHRCPNCGTEWSHGHSSFGNVAEHTCPGCGVVQWQVHRQGAANPLPAIGPFVVPRSSSSCPGGNCPAPAMRWRAFP